MKISLACFCVRKMKEIISRPVQEFGRERASFLRDELCPLFSTRRGEPCPVLGIHHGRFFVLVIQRENWALRGKFAPQREFLREIFSEEMSLRGKFARLRENFGSTVWTLGQFKERGAVLLIRQ